MACFTVITIEIEDSAINRKAREVLDLPLTGALSVYDARRVRTEAGVIKARIAIKKKAPNAVIRRKGNKLTVTISV